MTSWGRWLWVLLAWTVPSLAVAARIEGRVTSADGAPVVGALVRLEPVAGGSSASATTGPAGRFAVVDLGAGTYRLTANQRGYQATEVRIEIGDAPTAPVELVLELAPFVGSLRIEGVGQSVLNPTGPPTGPADWLKLLPAQRDRFADALPRLPGVVRGPDGKLSFQGARASQSTLLVNGSSATDPVTGEFVLDLPLKVIDEIEVFSVPYSAEYGDVNAAVANVVTRRGTDRWSYDLGGLFPSWRLRDGTVRGIKSFVPRLQVGGPLIADRLFVSQAASYRYVRSRVYDLVDPGPDEQIVEGVDLFTQLDWAVNARHWATATFSFYPLETDNFSLDTLHPAAASPHLATGGWNAAIGLTSQIGTGYLLENSLAVNGFDVEAEPRGQGLAQLRPTGLSANYFHRLDRDSRRIELHSSITSPTWSRAGQHRVRLGGQLTQVQFHSSDRSAPIVIRAGDGRLLRTVEHVGSGKVAADQIRAALYLRDRYRPWSSLGLDVGVRFDYDELTGDFNPAPRFAFAWSAFGRDRTVVRGGWGVFHQQLPLHAARFEDFQQRIERAFDDSGAVVEELAFVNQTATRLEAPRSVAWNLEIDQAIGDDWLVRVGYLERSGRRQPQVSRLEHGPTGPALVLESNGSSLAREFDATVCRTLPRDGKLFLAYSKSRTRGDLNDFTSIYGDQREPLLLAGSSGLQPFDVPHRFLLWGIVNLPWKLRLTAGVEWRNGFPYTVYDERWNVVGERNAGGRLPAFFAADLEVSREVHLFGHDLRVGLKTFNLTSHFNPRDVDANQASPTFGDLRNSPDIGFGLRFEFGR